MAMKKIPLRQCIGCGEMKNKREMIRVIKTPEGEILLDATGRKNGRGAYLCPSGECLKKAVKNKGLEKSVKSGRSCLVIVSEEASANTRKMFTNMCTYYKVPIYLFGTKEELGHAMGQEFRASLSVEDAGFAKSMAGILNINGGSVNESK